MSENNGLRKGSRSRATGAPGAISSECWPLVLVRWVDSTSPRMGWIRLSEWGGVGSLECVSAGYLIAEDERSKTIAPHLAYPEDAEQCMGNGIIVIPTAAIVSVDRLGILDKIGTLGQRYGHFDEEVP